MPSFPYGLIAQWGCDINVKTVLSVRVQAPLSSGQTRPVIPIFLLHITPPSFTSSSFSALG